jgi:hypothetical protein
MKDKPTCSVSAHPKDAKGSYFRISPIGIALILDPTTDGRILLIVPGIDTSDVALPSNRPNNYEINYAGGLLMSGRRANCDSGEPDPWSRESVFMRPSGPISIDPSLHIQLQQTTSSSRLH